jgi:hypothetical protein
MVAHNGVEGLGLFEQCLRLPGRGRGEAGQQPGSVVERGPVDIDAQHDRRFTGYSRENSAGIFEDPNTREISMP